MKKYVFLFALIFVGCGAYAAEPSTSCPTNYVKIKKTYLYLYNDSCPSGYTEVSTTPVSCLSQSKGVCFMYAPSDTNYSDSVGTYQFTEPCVYEVGDSFIS